MAIAEHPGWREFPLEIGQPVRADQINALWFAISERAAPFGSAPIEAVFGIYDTEEPFNFIRYEGGDRRCLVKGGGCSALLHNDYSAISGVVGSIAGAYINPEISLDEFGNQTAFPFKNWTISDLCKKLGIGGPTEEDPDIFSLTRIPDRGDEVIGTDENGGDVLFNDFFGEAEFGGPEKGDPTFVEHLNELYFIIKELKFIPFSGTGRGSETRIIGGGDLSEIFNESDEDSAAQFLGQWNGFRAATIALAAFQNKNFQRSLGVGGNQTAARTSLVRMDVEPQLGENDIAQEVAYGGASEAKLSGIPLPLFKGQTEKFGENNDLVSPYVYGTVRGWTNISFAFFTAARQDDSSDASSGANPQIKAVAISDLTPESASPVGVSDLQQGSLVFGFQLTEGIGTGEPILGEEQFLAEINLSGVTHMLPTADLGVDPADVTQEDLDNALNLWFAGSFDSYGDDFALGPPSGVIALPGVQTFFEAQRTFMFTEIFGFLELTGFTHGDRARDPLAPCFPSGQDCE